MVYGAINRKGEAYYTDLNRVLQAIGYRHKDYSWLITDCVCYPQNPAIAEMLSQDYCWLSGEQLSDLVMAENFQWIWADLCAFDKGLRWPRYCNMSCPAPTATTDFGRCR